MGRVSVRSLGRDQERPKPWLGDESSGTAGRWGAEAGSTQLSGLSQKRSFGVLGEVARRAAELKNSATLARSSLAFERPQPKLQPHQKSQSSSSVASALPITYDEPDPEKKSWFSSAFGDRAERIAGFTLVTLDGNIAS